MKYIESDYGKTRGSLHDRDKIEADNLGDQAVCFCEERTSQNRIESMQRTYQGRVLIPSNSSVLFDYEPGGKDLLFLDDRD